MTPATPAAIVLAGGRASRLGGAAKPLLEVDGRTLLDAAVSALEAAGCAPIVVSGPPLPTARAVVRVREEPAFGGPVAGIAAALPVIDAERVVVLAVDLARPADALAALCAGADALADRDGVCLEDPSGRTQWLAGMYRTAALRRGLDALPDGGRDASLRALTRGMRIATVPAPLEATRDIDTWQDLEQAQARGADVSDRTLPPEALDEWADAACARLGIDRAAVSVPLVLDLARDVAHGVARPAAPLSAYIAGLAAGRAGGDEAAQREAVAALTALANEWAGR